MTQGRRKREASIRLIQDQAVPNPSGVENRQCQVQVLLILGGSAESRWHRISESGSAALTQAAPSPGGAETRRGSSIRAMPSLQVSCINSGGTSALNAVPAALTRAAQSQNGAESRCQSSAKSQRRWLRRRRIHLVTRPGVGA